MGRFTKLLHDKILRRCSTLSLAVVISSFFFERVFDIVTDRIWESLNKGKLWDDIKDNYKVKGGGGGGDDDGGGGGEAAALVDVEEDRAIEGNEGGEDDEGTEDSDNSGNGEVVVETGSTEEVSNRKKLSGKSLLRYL